MNHHEIPAWTEGQSPLDTLRVEIHLDFATVAHTRQKRRELLHEGRQVIRDIERPLITPEAANVEPAASSVREGATRLHDQGFVTVTRLQIH
ncbi:hypothetical protein STXM2123_5936 [Streptomyces sp. F-3]|nr:hypothetical protein STXM2123_5936 [Streptomyces sp. F-3]